MTDLALKQTKRTPTRVLLPLGILLAVTMALTTTVFSPSDATAQAAAGPNTEFTVGDYVVEPGQEFDVVVTIDPVEVDVAGMEFRLGYDNTMIEPVLHTDPNIGTVNTPLCGSIAAGSSVCGPLAPTDFIAGAFLISSIGGPFLTSKTDIMAITFRVIGDGGAIALRLSDTQAGVNASRPTTTVDGSVTINGIDVPTPTPTPEPTNAMCRGKLVTIDMRTGADGTGTTGDDVIMGTFFDDVIDGREGNDTICGGGGADTIYGGAGNDAIWSGGGNDIVAGGDGNDTISGGNNNDIITGDGGDDDLRGAAGDDEVRGNAGQDLVHGGRGVDEVHGGPDDDEVRGGADNDLVIGGDGDDLVKGNNGDDKLLGGPGTNVLIGGNGTDDCVSDADADDKLRRCEPA